jgi:hypothetical protein
MNTRLMAEALIYCGQKCTVNKYEMNVNGTKMIVRDSIIYSDSGRTEFTGGKEFLTILFFEAILINCDRDAILRYYNSLVQSKSFVTK